MTRQTNMHRYEGRSGIVTYDAKRCIQAAECVRGDIASPTRRQQARRPRIVQRGGTAARTAGRTTA